MKEIGYKEVKEENRNFKNPSYVVEERKNSFIIIVGRGQKPTGGFDINIENVEQKGSKIFIRIRYFDPDPDEFVVQIITYPQTAVKIEKNDLVISDNLIFIFTNKSGEILAKKTK